MENGLGRFIDSAYTRPSSSVTFISRVEVADDADSLQILPIEVKSGKNYWVHSALNKFLSNKDYGVKRAIVLSNSQSSFDFVLIGNDFVEKFLEMKINFYICKHFFCFSQDEDIVLITF